MILLFLSHGLKVNADIFNNKGFNMLTHYISNTPEGKDFFEGKSQHLVAHAIYDTINSCTKLPHIMGLEGDWGSGKSNVIKQLSAIDNFRKKERLKRQKIAK